MADLTQWATAMPIVTGFKDWTGSQPHLYGKWEGRPLQQWAFADIYDETGLVIVRDNIFGGTNFAPYSFKVHNPGQTISKFTLSQLLLQSIYSTGTPINTIMNPVIAGAVAGAHADFITGERNYYNTWRLRAVNRHRDTGVLMGRCFAGSGVGPNGVSLTTSSGGITAIIRNPPLYFFSAAIFINLPPGNIFADLNFQLEVGFGGVANALATFGTLEATPEWPAYTSAINTTTV